MVRLRNGETVGVLTAADEPRQAMAIGNDGCCTWTVAAKIGARSAAARQIEKNAKIDDGHCRRGPVMPSLEFTIFTLEKTS
jgi:hypothetical protein